MQVEVTELLTLSKLQGPYTFVVGLFDDHLLREFLHKVVLGAAELHLVEPKAVLDAGVLLGHRSSLAVALLRSPRAFRVGSG